MSISGEHHEYIGDIMSTLGVFSTSEGYNEYIWGYSVHRMDTMSTVVVVGGGGGEGVIMSTLGDRFSMSRGYHDV